MTAAISDLSVGPVKKRTINASREAQTYHARETNGYFHTTPQTEAVLRFIAVVILSGAFIQWLMPHGESLEMTMTKVGMAVAFSITGLALYTFTMRGHRYELTLDPATRKLNLSCLDRRDNLRKSRSFNINEIKSIYVHKGDGVGTPAQMRIRLYRHNEEITALRGSYEDVELMHRALCRSIRLLKSEALKPISPLAAGS